MTTQTIKRPDRTIEHYLNGELHRTNGPAIIYPDEKKEYWFNGEQQTL